MFSDLCLSRSVALTNRRAFRLGDHCVIALIIGAQIVQNFLRVLIHNFLRPIVFLWLDCWALFVLEQADIGCDSRPDRDT